MENIAGNESKTLSGLVEHVLAAHHEPTRALLEKAKCLLRDAARDNLDNPLLNKLGMSFQSLAMTMHMHMEKEEVVLFPMFKRLETGFNTEKFCGSIENPISVMEYEHKELDLHFERIHRITSNYQMTADTPPAAYAIYEVLKELESDLKVHSEKEELELFPMAIKREKALGEKAIS